jgi:hypothetical protein
MICGKMIFLGEEVFFEDIFTVSRKSGEFCLPEGLIREQICLHLRN